MNLPRIIISIYNNPNLIQIDITGVKPAEQPTHPPPSHDPLTHISPPAQVFCITRNTEIKVRTDKKYKCAEIKLRMRKTYKRANILVQGWQEPSCLRVHLCLASILPQVSHIFTSQHMFQNQIIHRWQLAYILQFHADNIQNLAWGQNVLPLLTSRGRPSPFCLNISCHVQVVFHWMTFLSGVYVKCLFF